MQDHWSVIRERFIADRPVDPGVVNHILDFALFSNDEIVLARGLEILSEGAISGRPLFNYAKRNLGIDRIAGLFTTYQENFPRNQHIARYIASLIAAAGLHRECCDYIVSLQSVLPDDPAIAKLTVRSLSRAGREAEALPILENLHRTGQLDKAGWITLDRVLVGSGDLEKAEEIFEQAVAIYAGDGGFIVSAIRARDRALAVVEADRIQEKYLDRMPLSKEIAELKMQRHMRAHRYENVLDIATACSRAGIGNPAIAALEAECRREMVRSLARAGRGGEALPILEDLHRTGQLDQSGWMLMDRLLLGSGDREKAEEIFEQAAAIYAGDVGFIVSAIRTRDKALAVVEADRIQEKYLDRIPLSKEIAELKMQRHMRVHRFEDALDIATACSRAGIGNQAIAALEAQCHVETALSLERAGREGEALSVLETLHGAGQLNKAGWIALDRIAVRSGDRKKAEEIFEQAAALYKEDVRFILDAVRARDRALAVMEADRIQQKYLDRFPVTGEIAELKMRRHMRVHRFMEALDVAAACMQAGIGSQVIAALGTQCYMELGMPGRATAFLKEMESECGVVARDGWGLLEYFARAARYPQAREHISYLESSGKASLVPRRILEKWKGEIRVFDDTARILSRFPNSPIPRGVVVLFAQGGCLSHIWMGLTAAELKKSGFAVVFPCLYGCCDVEMTGDPDIDGLQGVLDFSMKRLTDEPEGIPSRRFEWTIDIEKGIVSACGLNFFQPISARIGTILRCYRFSFDHPVAKATLNAHVSIADAMLALCERIRGTLGRRNIPVRFLCGMTHYVPAAVLRQYCDAHGYKFDMNYVAFVAAYEHYYTNLGNDRTGALSLHNLTKNRALTAPGRVNASEFESWACQLSDAEKKDIRSEMMSIIKFDRTGKTESREAALVLERIRNHKAAGGSVACLFGKILYDIWMDEPTGTAHTDIVDWVNHSIEAVAGSDTLLLVKPHPNEINRMIADPTEFFFDLIQTEINGNVILCEHKWFNVGDLLPYLDLGLLWSGTAGLELQACGIAVSMCSKSGLLDHPACFVEAQDRAHYESLLRHPGGQRVAEAVRDRCLLLLKYYSTPEVMIPYGYGNMNYLRGKDIGPPCWHMDKVEQYINHGDPNVERMARSCL